MRGQTWVKHFSVLTKCMMFSMTLCMMFFLTSCSFFVIWISSKPCNAVRITTHKTKIYYIV